MSLEEDVDHNGEKLANGDTVSERVEKVDIDEEDTCSTDEMRELLGL
ncbi:hypothetical protein ACEU6E_10875 (plasmid) [Halorutilales archaeon Cl-col2-1]